MRRTGFFLKLPFPIKVGNAYRELTTSFKTTGC